MLLIMEYCLPLFKVHEFNLGCVAFTQSRPSPKSASAFFRSALLLLYRGLNFWQAGGVESTARRQRGR
jgi:hypothetical protein